jgi:hypothetical protein
MIGDGAAVIPILAWYFVISTTSVEGKAKSAETCPLEKIPSVHVRSYLCMAVVFCVDIVVQQNVVAGMGKYNRQRVVLI